MSSTDPVWLQSSGRWSHELTEANITIEVSISFQDGNFNSNVLVEIRKATRIVIAAAWEDDTVTIAVAALKRNMTAGQNVSI